MILFKLMETDNEEMLDNLLEQYDLIPYKKYRMAIALEGETPLGFIFFEVKEGFCKIDKFYMTEENDLIKDGLIRTLINAMDLRNIKQIIAKKDREESFLFNLGFYPLFYSGSMINSKVEESMYCAITTKEFFENKSCKD